MAASTRAPSRSSALYSAVAAGRNAGSAGGQTFSGMTARSGWPGGSSRPTCQKAFRSERASPLAASAPERGVAALAGAVWDVAGELVRLVQGEQGPGLDQRLIHQRLGQAVVAQHRKAVPLQRVAERPGETVGLGAPVAQRYGLRSLHVQCAPGGGLAVLEGLVVSQMLQAAATMMKATVRKNLSVASITLWVSTMASNCANPPAWLVPKCNMSSDLAELNWFNSATRYPRPELFQ